MESSEPSASSSSPRPHVGTTIKALISEAFYSASTKERKVIFEKAKRVIRDRPGDINDPMVKAMCRILPVTLPRYHDGGSRHETEELVELLVGLRPDLVFTVLTQALWDNLGQWKNLVPTTSNAKTALAALKWTCIVFRYTELSALKNGECEKLIEMQAILATVIFGSNHGRLGKSTLKLLRKTWNLDKEKTIKAFASVAGKIDSTSQILLYHSHYMEWLVKIGDKATGSDQIKKLVQGLVKVVISNKCKADPVLVKNLGPLLSQVSHDDFKNDLLPAILRAMLRNPEIILSSVAYILDQLSIDLSQYVQELKGPFSSHLHSNNAAVRMDAMQATIALARQMSDHEALEALVNTLFDILGGSDGKLTVDDQKCSLIKAIGSISVHTSVPVAALQNACKIVVARFTKILESEVHEGTLLETLTNLSLWCKRLCNDIPQEFIAWFSNGLALKERLTNRKHLKKVINKLSLKSSTLDSAVKLVPILMKSVDTCAKQFGQALAVTEGVMASGCLVKLSLLEAETVDKLQDFWKIALDESKAIFHSDRFLLSASPRALICAALVAESVVMDKLNLVERWRPWMKVVIMTATSQNLEARQFGKATIHRMLSGLGGCKIGACLLEELDCHIKDERISILPNCSIQDSTSTDGQNNTTFQAKFFVDILETVAESLKVDATDAPVAERDDVITRLLNPSHADCVRRVNPTIWPRLVRRMGVDPRQFVSAQEGLLREVFSGEICHDAVATLVEHNADKIVPEIVEVFSERVTKTELVIPAMDYQIFLTPKDELFNRQVLEAVQSESSKETKNIKRESKAYSYKEQMEEMALRKEIEEKRRKAGKSVEPKLTQKQKEAIKVQLEKEDKIRTHVGELSASILPVLDVVAAAVAACPKPFAAFIGKLSQGLFNGFKSPICAKKCCEIFTELRRGVFDADDETLAQKVAAMIIQVKQPSYSLPFAMDSEQLQISTKSVSMLLAAQTLESVAPDPELACPLKTPGFCYSFPLLDCAARSQLKDGDFIIICCKIIYEHASLRGIDEELSILALDEFHPKYLPIEHMLKLLVHLIECMEGPPQQNAASALLEVCLSASGRSGCASAHPEDVQVLLNALQSDNILVREAAIHGIKASLDALLALSGDPISKDVVRRLWISRFDVCEENGELARSVWVETSFDSPKNLHEMVLKDVVHPVAAIRTAASDALAESLEEHPSQVAETLDLLLAEESDFAA